MKKNKVCPCKGKCSSEYCCECYFFEDNNTSGSRNWCNKHHCWVLYNEDACGSFEDR